MLIVQDPEDDDWHWLSKDRKEFNEFENYCLLAGINVDYSPQEYGISTFPFEMGFLYPDYYNLQLLQEEEQALIEFAKIKDDEIKLYSLRYGDSDEEQRASIYPYQPTDGGRMFGQES